MRQPVCLVCAFVALVALLPSGCGDQVPDDPPGDADVAVDGDVGAVDGDGDVDGADGDGDGTDGDVGDAHDGGPSGLSGSGPVTLMFYEVNIVTDRLCDPDGDGRPNNALADLGSMAEVVTMALNSAFGTVAFDRPAVMHFPLVDDRSEPTDPEALAIFFRGEPLDDDPSNDLSGVEPYWADDFFLDDCGEPLYAVPDSTMERGRFVAAGSDLFLSFGPTFTLRQARVEGTIEPGCVGAEVLQCGAASIQDLGATPAPEEVPGHTMLEVFVAGGILFGVPSVPGLSPDVDVDGDGLERVMVDEDGRIERCIDGDMTIFSGRECWMHPEMADAFAITVRAQAVSASFAGREPSWEERAARLCDELPVESLFDQ